MIQVEKHDNGTTADLYFDQDYIATISTKLFPRIAKELKHCLTLEHCEELFSEIELKKAKNRALRLLQKKPLFCCQIREKLKEFHIRYDTIEEVIRIVEGYGFLNDQDLLQQFVKHYSTRRKSAQWIKHKLMQKGLDSQLLELIPSLICKSTTKESIDWFIQKKYYRYELNDSKDRQKVTAALYRKGFAINEINEAICRLCQKN